jgi:hypothetical protein
LRFPKFPSVSLTIHLCLAAALTLPRKKYNISCYTLQEVKNDILGLWRKNTQGLPWEVLRLYLLQFREKENLKLRKEKLCALSSLRLRWDGGKVGSLKMKKVRCW